MNAVESFSLFYDQNAIAKWVSDYFGNPLSDFDKSVSIGFLRGKEIVGGAVFSNYKKDSNNKPLSIEVTLVSLDNRWALRNNLRALFHYPFVQLRVKRLEAKTSIHNHRARDVLIKLGFIQEGIMREAWPYGGGKVIYSMLSNECRWLKNGKYFQHPGHTSSP